MQATPMGGTAMGAELCFTAIDKALKTLNLYMGQGELAEASIAAVTEAMTRFLGTHERLDYTVSAHGLTHGGQTYETGKQSSRYYFYLFKDGVRELSFVEGLTEVEIRAFLQIMIDRHHDAGLEGTEGGAEQWEFRDQDSVTRLWEADFQHVRYHAIDVYAAGELYDSERGTRRSLAEMVADRMRAYRPGEGRRPQGSLAEAAPPVGVRQDGWMALTPAVSVGPESLAAMRDEASADDLLHLDRFAIIWARLVQTASDADRPQLISLMLATFRAWVEEANWDALQRGLKILQALAALPAHRAMVQDIVRKIAEPEELQRLTAPVLQAPPEDTPKIVLYFGALGHKSVMALARILVDLPPGPAHDAWVEAFAGRGLEPLTIQLARLRSKDGDVVRDAMRCVVDHAQDESVQEALRQLLARRDAQLRLAALKMLGTDPDPRTRQALHRGLVDHTQHIRSHSIRTLGGLVDEPFAQQALLERVVSKPFKALHPVERNLLLVAAARVGGAQNLGWFRSELGRHSLFGAKKLRGWHDELKNALREARTEATAALLAEVGDGD